MVMDRRRRRRCRRSHHGVWMKRSGNRNRARETFQKRIIYCCSCCQNEWADGGESIKMLRVGARNKYLPRYRIVRSTVYAYFDFGQTSYRLLVTATSLAQEEDNLTMIATSQSQTLPPYLQQNNRLDNPHPLPHWIVFFTTGLQHRSSNNKVL